jgi:RNA methyltransferase, TrmH family
VPTVRSVVSRDNPLLMRVRKLATDPAAYRKQGEIWLEGDHLASAYLARGGHAPKAVVTEDAWAHPALAELASRADEVVVLPTALMATLSSLESPSAMGFVVPWPGAGALDPAAPSLVLDRLQDAGNVGTLLRSASAFGFGQVLALKGTAALWSPKVLRAGMGAHFGLNLVEGIEADALAALAVPMLATSSHAGRALHEVDLPWPCAWVLGHEGRGVGDAVMRRCAQVLRIAQPGGEESLNVAAAAAICPYESARQRLTGPRR